MACKWQRNGTLEIAAWLIIIAGGAVAMLSSRLSQATQNTIGVIFIVAGMAIFTPYFLSSTQRWKFPNCTADPYSWRCIILYMMLVISLVAIGYEVGSFVYDRIF
jgi:hypothetical protein